VSSTDEPTFEVLARGPWPRARVRVREAPDFLVPREHDALVESTWRAALEAARARGQRLYPGPLFGLASFAIDAKGIELALHRTDFRALVGTNLSAAYRETGARGCDALGISIIIVQPDGRILVHRRGSQCYEHPLAIDTPGGHAEPGVHADPFAAALDELEGELGIVASEVVTLELLGLTRILETRKPQAVVLARVTVDRAAVAGRLAGAREGFETSELLSPLAPSELAGLARSRELVSPAGRAALGLAASIL
jgi:8-oxo-dGTP pyrophosphatase MutT (NUDIX family)